MNEYELLYYYRLNPTTTFNEIVKQFEKLMYSSIHKVCYNFSDQCFETSDAFQEGLFSLVSSLDNFRDDLGSQFSSYLYTCVTSSTRLLMRKHRSLSFGLLDRSLSLSFPVTVDESVTLLDVVAERTYRYDPEYMAQFEDKVLITYEILSSLKESEKQVFVLRNDGYSYEEIAGLCQMSTKKVDNILQKIRRIAKEAF